MATRNRLGSEAGDAADVRIVADEAPDLIGEVVDGRYRITDLIGSGGMARVFLAQQVRLQRPVAVKVLHPGFGRIPEVCQRFEREAIAIARLDHPNCVTVFDSGQLPDGSLYLVMQLLNGTLLTDAVGRGPLPARRALHVARHILSALAHAHRAGIVHRDIKADNVMLVPHQGDADFATILDFGIAKLSDPLDPLAGDEPAMEQLTVAGQRFGTPAYMSPEQALGKPIDERTDVYSTAVVLFEMLTGRRPFESPDDAAVLAMHAGKPPPTLAARSAGIDLPGALEELIARGLEKDPDDRYASAGEFIVAIDECVENLYPGPARIAAAAAEAGDQTATTVVARPGRWWTRRRIAIAAAVCVVAIGALAFFSTTRNDYAAKARQLLADGKPEEAIEYLESHGDDIGGDADAQLELGHAYAAVRRNDDAIGAYARAVNEQSSVGDDETLRTNVRLMLDDPRSDAAAAAATLLVTKLGDDAGRAKLIEVASRHRNAAHRARMRELAEKLGLGDDIDRVRSYTLDLAQGKTCDDRRSAVARLRALGDPAAIAGIEKAAKRKRNKCLRADADEAVQYLRSRK